MRQFNIIAIAVLLAGFLLYGRSWFVLYHMLHALELMHR